MEKQGSQNIPREKSQRKNKPGELKHLSIRRKRNQQRQRQQRRAKVLKPKKNIKEEIENSKEGKRPVNLENV